MFFFPKYDATESLHNSLGSLGLAAKLLLLQTMLLVRLPQGRPDGLAGAAASTGALLLGSRPYCTACLGLRLAKDVAGRWQGLGGLYLSSLVAK